MYLEYIEPIGSLTKIIQISALSLFIKNYGKVN